MAQIDAGWKCAAGLQVRRTVLLYAKCDLKRCRLKLQQSYRNELNVTQHIACSWAHTCMNRAVFGDIHEYSLRGAFSTKSGPGVLESTQIRRWRDARNG